MVEVVDMIQEGVPVCILKLEDVDQWLHQTQGALGQDPHCTGLQLC